MIAADRSAAGPPTPFSGERLDALLSGGGIDAVLATSPHNTRYLLGGYRFFLYDRSEAVGSSRYLPIVGYVAGRADQSFYVGAGNEDWDTEVRPPWVPDISNVAWGTVDAAEAAAARVADRGLEATTVGIEPAYLPADAMDALAQRLPHATFVDATDLLDELRAVKSGSELKLVRRGSAAVVDAILATFAGLLPGQRTETVVERLRREETRRGLTFAYGLIATGMSYGRAPNGRVVAPGGVLSLDSGADLDGYVADVARMGLVGEPSIRHVELLEQVDAVQQAARRAVAGGRQGAEVPEAAGACLATQPDAARMSFQVHGMGLLTHEAPRLMADAAPPYPATHRDRPLEAGMVLSIETHVADPGVGFVKLEDTVIVTPRGSESVSDNGRGWNSVGADAGSVDHPAILSAW